MNVSRSKSGLPTICESGGGMTNTGCATVICGHEGEKIEPLWVPRGYSNGEHAGFVAKQGMCIVEADHDRSREYVSVRVIHRIGNKDDPDELFLELIGEWENNDGTIPARFEAARKAALGKSYCYHCREPHYILE